MKLNRILLLGNPRLYETSEPVGQEELEKMKPVVADLHDILMEFRAKYHAGRAIAAPQIGVMKRLIYMHINQPVVFINPVISEESQEMMELWDDCMCFPNLLVKLQRHRRCRITFRNLDWQEQTMWLEDDLSELLQHEYDHLNGILATQRALSPTSFSWRPDIPPIIM
jgi:peptide deformylase